MSAPCPGRPRADGGIPKPSRDDVYLLNDPYRGGSHLPDLTAFVPVFDADRLVFWSVVRAHHSDIGGATHGAYNPAATEIWHEGLRVPPIRLTENGVLREDLLDMLALNVRHPRDFRGDLAAQIGAARLGEQRLGSVIGEFGGAVLLEAVNSMLDAAESHTREIVGAWTDGIYEGDAWLDDDGFGKENIRIHARCTVAGSDVTVDLTGSDPQVTGFVNSSHANTQSAVTMAFAFLLDPDQARNAGAFRPLHVIMKPGTIVWANEGAPVTMCTSHCSNEIIEAIIVALAPACPQRAMGGWGRRLRIAINGRDPRSGRRFIWHMFQARPGGGGSWPATAGPPSANGTPPAASSSAASRWRKPAFPCSSRRTSSVPARAARDGSAAGTAATCGCGWKPTGRGGQHGRRRHRSRRTRHIGRPRRRAARLHAAGAGAATAQASQQGGRDRGAPRQRVPHPVRWWRRLGRAAHQTRMKVAQRRFVIPPG